MSYHNSEFLDRDDEESVKWFRLAAGPGFLLAKTNLGVAFGEGRGVEQNDVIAHMWLNIASTRGDINARANVRHIERRMSISDIAKACKLARNCVKSIYRGCGTTPI